MFSIYYMSTNLQKILHTCKFSLSILNNKALPFHGKGFFFVDNEFEISNHDLITEMDKIINQEEV